MNSIITYIRESFGEVLHGVTWPKYSELQSSAILVIVASLVFTTVVMVIDQVFDQLLSLVY